MSESKPNQNAGSQRNQRETKKMDPGERQAQQRAAVARRMSQVKRKVMVLSGKGGVGKSTVAVNLAIAAGQAGIRTGLLDIDIHGPSIPKLLGLEGHRPDVRGNDIQPIEAQENLKVMSIGFLLENRDDAVIWRGPMKYNAIRQFLAEVEWGELDLLIVDSPPGTGDEPLSVVQLVGNADGAIVVTTPQEVALADVRKCINFCRQLSLPVLGVIENMSGFRCPRCGNVTDVFGSGGGEKMAADMAIPFLGKMPIDRRISESGDSGKPYVTMKDGLPSAELFRKAAVSITRTEREE